MVAGSSSPPRIKPTVDHGLCSVSFRWEHEGLGYLRTSDNGCNYRFRLGSSLPPNDRRATFKLRTYRFHAGPNNLSDCPLTSETSGHLPSRILGKEALLNNVKPVSSTTSTVYPLRWRTGSIGERKTFRELAAYDAQHVSKLNITNISYRKEFEVGCDTSGQ